MAVSPSDDWTVIVYVVVEPGETTFVPLAVVAPKFDETTLAALSDCHAKVVLCPFEIVGGVAPS